jgi:hypothetical protein
MMSYYPKLESRGGGGVIFAPRTHELENDATQTWKIRRGIAREARQDERTSKTFVSSDNVSWEQTRKTERGVYMFLAQNVLRIIELNKAESYTGIPRFRHRPIFGDTLRLETPVFQ